MSSKINIGDIIEIIFNNVAYRTKVENIIDDVNYVVGTPIIHNSYVYVSLDSRVLIRYIAKDGIYQFEGKVTQKKTNNINLLIITQTGPMERIQRRENFRLRTAISGTIIKKDDNVEYECIIKDISGGGAKLSTSYKLGINDEVVLNFTLEGIGGFVIKGKIIRITNNGLNYDIGLSFIDLSSTDEEKIVGYVFQEQRKLIQKGLVE